MRPTPRHNTVKNELKAFTGIYAVPKVDKFYFKQDGFCSRVWVFKRII